MSTELRFDGRVVVVTGAGAGLGRAYALLFASRGASVVVNDLGGGRHGDGSSSKAADSVVQEIKDKGGKAVANYNSVVDGEKIIQTALDSFGRIDVVVNNAGILRDKSFARISESDWNLIQDVHLRGAFKVTQAAWPWFRKQNYGRVIFTSSNSALCGNFGQANYSAAKMALVGLCNTLAIEGAKNNIKCNTIVPTAASRLTEDILPPELYAELKPELIAPVVLWLCHEHSEETGSVIETAAGWARRVYLVRGNGTLLRNSISEGVTPEEVRNRWEFVTDMNNAAYTSSIEETTIALVDQLENLRSGVKIEKSATKNDSLFTYQSKDVILYALGIGISLENSSNLKYLYESDPDFSVFPTYVLIPTVISLMTTDRLQNAVPGEQIDFSMVLHGEQYLELYKPLASSGTLRSELEVTDIVSKGEHATMLVDVHTYDEFDTKVAYSQCTVFLLGCGGFTKNTTTNKDFKLVFPPARQPDYIALNHTLVDQAAIYRLSGDTNPLHIDPQIAKLMRLDQPILHGLCTLGFAVNSVINIFADNDPQLFKALKVRFSKPVIPGQTLCTSMWREGCRIIFETRIYDTPTVVLSGGYVDLFEVKFKMTIQPQSSDEELLSDLVFAGMKERIDADPSIIKKVNGVFLYKITKNGKEVATWTSDLKNGNIYKGEPKDGLKADTTLTIDDSDFADMALGKLNPQIAFIKGKLKIKGNIMLTQKLKSLMTAEPKL